MSKVWKGRHFEDFSPGLRLVHSPPRTMSEGDRALYGALYPSRFALHASQPFARNLGYADAPLEDLAVFHAVFGQSVADVSLNAVANLGYGEGRFLAPVFAGDTLFACSDVIGLKQTSSGRSGIVYVRTIGTNQHGDAVLSYVRWVLVPKRDPAFPAPEPLIPSFSDALDAADLVLPEGLDLTKWDEDRSGSPHRWDDYTVGERLDHREGVTIEEAEHMMATRLWRNNARVHFDGRARKDGRRLVYGGHVLSLARALASNGLANAPWIAGINGGTHANPCFAGDVLYAWSEVLAKAETANPALGALRLRLAGVKNRACADFPLRGADGKYLPELVLDFDYWAFIPR